MLSISAALSFSSAVSGIVALTAAKQYKGLLLTAVTFLFVSAILLAIAAAHAHTHNTISGMLPMSLIVTSLLLKFISNIFLLFVVVKLQDTAQQTTVKASIAAISMTSVSMIMSGVLLVFKGIAYLRRPVIKTQPSTVVTQKPPYTNPQGAREQLDQLRTATIETPGANITIAARPTRPLNPNAPEFVPESALGFL